MINVEFKYFYIEKRPKVKYKYIKGLRNLGKSPLFDPEYKDGEEGTFENPLPQNFEEISRKGLILAIIVTQDYGIHLCR